MSNKYRYDLLATTMLGQVLITVKLLKNVLVWARAELYQYLCYPLLNLDFGLARSPSLKLTRLVGVFPGLKIPDYEKAQLCTR